MPGPTDPAALLTRLLRRDTSRPLLTYYDVGTGGRVELSVATLENWVAKTAGLLRDELGVEPGDRVSVVLPAHWLGLVWAQAVWTAGASLVLAPGPAAVHVLADGSAGDAPTAASGGGEVVVVATGPLGGPARALPPGAVDYGREVLGLPDRFVPTDAPDDPLLTRLLDEVRDEAPQPVPARRLLASDDLDAELVRDGLLRPLVDGGSTVLVRPSSVDPEQLARIAADERASLTTDRS